MIRPQVIEPSVGVVGTEERPGRVLIVDDEVPNRRLLRRLLERAGHQVCEADTGEHAIECVIQDRPDLVLLDVLMPGMNGFDVCRVLKQRPESRLIPVVLITALTQPQHRIVGLDSGADDFISKPVNPLELAARVRSLVRIKRITDELDSAEAVIVSLALTIEARDGSTEGHCERLATYGCALGRQLGLDQASLSTLARGGYLHDVGKVAIPDAILLKPGPLTPAEFAVMKQHTVIGDRLCGQLRALERVRPIVRHHHERLDGSGYPDGLRGDAIPLLAQVTGIVDVFDALTTQRPYKSAMTAEEASDVLRTEVRRGWRRRDLVEMFLAMVARGDLGQTLRPGTEVTSHV